MTGRGGAEGYLFTATRVVPAEGRVEARGKFARKKTEVKSASGNGEPAAKKVKVEDGAVVEGDVDPMTAAALETVETQNAAFENAVKEDGSGVEAQIS